MIKFDRGIHMTIDDLKAKYSGKFSHEGVNGTEAKAEKLRGNTVLGQIWDKIQLLFAIVKHPKEFGPEIVMAVGAVLIYLVSPVDAIPDAIPVVGYTDDVAAILMVINSITASIQQKFAEDPERLLSLLSEKLRAAAIRVFKLFGNTTK